MRSIAETSDLPLRVATLFFEDNVFGAAADSFTDPDLAVPGTRLKVKMFDRLWPAEVVEDSPYDPANAAIRKDR